MFMVWNISLRKFLYGISILMRILLFTFSGVPIGLYQFSVYHMTANPSMAWFAFAMLAMPTMAFACWRWFELLASTPWWPHWWAKLWIALSICASIVFCLFPIEKATIGMWFIACHVYLVACLIAIIYPKFEELREHIALRRTNA
ncbi:hypothetical protein Aaci_0600 [Alicyclobacillus acidocaldarius subsp. acidocaldarius DSM 446]|uniref:Uncharacterized protein n=2 Tax=Alicyclobacillus acidocaldarius TaxID=405212 RepID=C8WSZ2_ALIAD|nr:hypothetical protein Aaci_0600 [Alicyclobacillus acidocaldarius subsp. acidocaldarius DSM 446]